jgi:hypothetical protein
LQSLRKYRGSYRRIKVREFVREGREKRELEDK